MSTDCRSPDCPDSFESEHGETQHYVAVHGPPTEEELVDSIIEVAGFLGLERAPTKEEVDNHGKWSSTTIQKHLGSWNEAVRKAGFEPNIEHGSKQAVSCDWCGESFMRTPREIERHAHNFHPECYGEWRSDVFTGPDAPGWEGGKKTTVECAWCGNPKTVFESTAAQTQRTFCESDCWGSWLSEHLRGENNPQYIDGENRYYGPEWLKTAEEIRNRDGACQGCGLSLEEHFELYGAAMPVHHIVPLREFLHLDNPYEVANADDNLVSLCGPCHAKWEGIPLRPTLTGVQQ